MTKGDRKMKFGQPRSEPILGAQYSLPTHALFRSEPIQDYSMPVIPVFKHLKMYHVEVIEVPTFKKCLHDAKHKLLITK